jgi:hypothetical protein
MRRRLRTTAAPQKAPMTEATTATEFSNDWKFSRTVIGTLMR